MKSRVLSKPFLTASAVYKPRRVRQERRQSLPSPYKGTKFRRTQKGSTTKYAQLERVKDKKTHHVQCRRVSCSSQLHQTLHEIPRDPGVIFRTVCRTGLLLLLEFFWQRLRLLTPFSGRHVRDSKKLSKKMITNYCLGDSTQCIVPSTY